MLSTKKALSEFYVKNGMSVIPIGKGTKKAFLKGWDQYGSKQPTEEEINKWFGGKDDKKSNNGYELAVVLGYNGLLGIDCDNLNTPKILFDSKIEDIAKKTWVVKTGRGYHIYYTYNKDNGGNDKSQYKNRETIKKENVIELYTGGRYFLAPPSRHPNGGQYKFLTDIENVKIKELTELEHDLLLKRCRKVADFLPFIEIVSSRWGDGLRHNVAVPMAGFLRKTARVGKKDAKFIMVAICRLTDDNEVEDRLKAVDDTWGKSIKEISGISGLVEIYDDGFVKELKTSLGIKDAPHERKNDKEKDKEEQQNIIETASLITDEFIAEEVWNPPRMPQFAVYNFSSGEFTIKDSIEVEVVYDDDEEGTTHPPLIYVPISNAHIFKGMVIVPRKPVKCTFDELIPDAVDFVHSGFDACGKDSEVKLYVLLAIESWILDKERSEHPIAGVGVFAPILPIRGPSGSGKNRLANMLRFLSYHPFFDVSTYRIPSLFRPLDLWRGTLVIDEGDFKNTDENSELIHFLNARATGTPIGRQNPNNVSECQVFDSFGETIITQRRHFDDNATEGRAIPMFTDVGTKEYATLETQDLIDRGRDMQDRLLYLRMKHWNDFTIDKSIWIDGTSDHRLNSALLPLMALSTFIPWIEDFIKTLIKPIERERRKIKAQSSDGSVINIMWDKISEGSWSTHKAMFFLGNGTEYSKSKNRDEDMDEREEVVLPMTSTSLGELLGGISGNAVKKIITSLNITPETAPITARINSKVKRPIFFDPIRLEKRLVEFVVDYNKGELCAELGHTNDAEDAEDEDTRWKSYFGVNNG